MSATFEGRMALWPLYQDSPASGLLQRQLGWPETSEYTPHLSGGSSSITVMIILIIKLSLLIGHKGGSVGLRKSESMLNTLFLNW